MDKKKIKLILEGNIGTGKTTLGKKLVEKYKDSEFITEPVNDWINIKDNDDKQNILEKFYINKERWGYTFQTYAFLTKAKLISKPQEKSIRFLERSILTDKNVFAKALYESGEMSNIEWKMYQEWSEWIYKEIEEKVGSHDGIIYIRCDPLISYDRVKIRLRAEENLIPLEYLEKIHKYHDEWLLNNSNVIVIDVNNDFENNEKELEIIINKISEFIDKIYQKNNIDSKLNKNITTNCSIN
jgi:deoxyadenosine/deoxycytidine kinase